MEGFSRDIRDASTFVKGLREMQMHCRALEKTGEANPHFITEGLASGTLDKLSVNGVFSKWRKNMRDCPEGS